MIQPQLSSQEAGEDGLAVKRMVAAGAGIPLHFLAEPESATRTTAEFAGGPTFRRYEQRQKFFLWMLEDLTRMVLHPQGSREPQSESGCGIDRARGGYLRTG